MIAKLVSRVFADNTNRFAALTVLIGTAIAVLLLNPVWQQMNLHVPGESSSRVDFTQPVDSAFYVRNAEYGFNWTIEDKISTAFHPLLTWSIGALSSPIPHNIRYWLISVIAAFFSLIAIHSYIREISDVQVGPIALLWVLVLPGGLGIATGNAEFPCLLFTTLLALSVIKKWRTFWPVAFGVLAILTKPNAAYMIPFLGVYALFQRRIRITSDRPDTESLVVTVTHHVPQQYRKIIRNSGFGIAGIMVAWFIWILVVDLQLGELGGYLKVRGHYTVPLELGILSLFNRTATVLLFYSDFGEQLKFVTAIAVPLVMVWISLLIPLDDELHRIAIIVGTISMFLIAMLTNNPNKIAVYVTTFPGTIASGIIFFDHFVKKLRTDLTPHKLVNVVTGVSFLCFCIAMMVFYVLGTPLGWYY